jgi:hypothetical protein
VKNITPTELRQRRQDLRDAIWLNGPAHFNMNTWFNNGQHVEDFDLADATKVHINTCGTTACIAGTAALVLLDTKAVDRDEWAHMDHESAENYITDYFGLHVDLFITSWWHHFVMGEDQLVFDPTDDQESLGHRYRHYLSQDMPAHVAEWHAAVDYLDSLIKAGE